MDLALIARVLWMRRTLRAREHWTPDQIAAYRRAQLLRLRSHAYTHSPFYRTFHAGMETRPLDQLPVLTKAVLMNAFDDVVTDRGVHFDSIRTHLDQLTSDELFLRKYRVTRTSGSTGSPGIFLSTPVEWASIIASYARAQEWAGIMAPLTSRTRLAVVSSRIPWHQSARVGASVDSPFFPIRRFDSTEPLETIVAGLNAWQPENLIAYASMARVLAEEQLSGRLRIAPRAVMCASEVLTQDSRAKIQRAWHSPPFNVYAATETAGIASECTHRRLHLFEDLVITEVVDEANRPVPPGEIGAKVLVTVLFSRTQPLIRYEMSDRVMLSPERCDCGLPFSLLGKVEGRTEEILQLPARGGGSVRIHPNVFHELLESLPVQAWQVVQEQDAVRILLQQPGANVDIDRLRNEVVRALEHQNAIPPPVRVERVETVNKSATGKAPLIKAFSRSTMVAT